MRWCIFDITNKEKRIALLEKKSIEPDFWLDSRKAQQLMQELSQLKEETTFWRNLEEKVTELGEFVELAIEEEDSSLEDEIVSEIAALESQLEEAEFQRALGGEYDKRNVLLAIHAGAGGTESQDWASMLLRMYLRWAERKNYKSEVLETSPGEEAGIKSALVEVKGKFAYGYLKAERGVHRLVRLSPFDADHARHTSFVLVEVMPEAETDVEVDINSDDLRIDTFKSSGPGGQHMQKTSSAVRITHLPTGIVVSCQNERSQHQNKETALRILRSRLLEFELKKEAEEQAKLKGEYITAEWGNQIRSYVLHPYKLVKDHRSGYETTNPNAVLDGDLDGLIKAYLNRC